MEKPPADRLEIRTASDIVRVRQAVRERAVGIGFGLVEQTKIVTAASELARNALDHAGGGTLEIELLGDDRRRGLRLIFEDQGPGIPDVERALEDGFSTAFGLGLGLGGAGRLMSELTIESQPGAGTRITATRWKSR